jgi:two-component system cell cycle sensor histidine kinase/response regulator CckA
MKPSEPPQAVVLVVDDEREIVDIVTRVLANDGYELLTAASGADALAVAAACGRPIDLLLTDLHMPEMSGRGLATELRRTQPGLKVVYLTGHCDDLFGAVTLLEPHEAFIEKPIAPALVREAVCLHLFGRLTPATV